jgi:hypothetical protein
MDTTLTTKKKNTVQNDQINRYVGLNKSEPARVVRRSDGDVMGVAVVLSPEDLRKLGINLTETNAVRPRIQSGVVLLETIRG